MEWHLHKSCKDKKEAETEMSKLRHERVRCHARKVKDGEYRYTVEVKESL